MFDIDGARKAGYSDEEIADYLGQQKNFDTVAARDSGYSDAELISHLSASQDITPPEEQSTAWGTASRGAMESLIPSAAGIAAFMPGFEAGAAVGSVAGPVGTVAGGLIGGLGTSMGAGALVHEGQKYLLDKMPEVADYLGLDQEQRALDEKLHPYANLAGSLIPQALAFRPSVSNLKSLGAIPEAASAAERSAIIGNRINVGAGAAIGGGQEAAMEYLDTGEVDPYKVAIATAAGATMNTPTAIGEKLNAVGARLTPDFVSRNNPYSPNYKNKTMTELVEEEKAKIYNPINAATRDRIDENQVDLGKAPYEEAPDAIITPAGDVEAQIEVKASPLQRVDSTSNKAGEVLRTAEAEAKNRPDGEDKFLNQYDKNKILNETAATSDIAKNLKDGDIFVETADMHNPATFKIKETVGKRDGSTHKTIVDENDEPVGRISVNGELDHGTDEFFQLVRKIEEGELVSKSNNTIGKSADSTQKSDIIDVEAKDSPLDSIPFSKFKKDSMEVLKNRTTGPDFDGNPEYKAKVLSTQFDLLQKQIYEKHNSSANIQKLVKDKQFNKFVNNMFGKDLDIPMSDAEKAQLGDYKDAVAKDERKAQGLKHNEQVMYIGGTTKINKTDFNLVQKRNKLMEWNIKNPENQKPIPEKAAMAHKKYESFADDLKDVDFVPGGNIETFEPMFSKAVDEKNLIVQHNLTEENLAHAEKMGGIPVPSLAITKKDIPLDSFGEITLLGNKELADPKGYAKTQVYGADIYSPRYPRVDEETNKIFNGYTPSGKRKYLDHNLDNVVKIMKKNMRGGEGWNYGTGNLRAMVTPQFKTIKDIKASSDKLTTGEHFKKVKEEVNDELFTLRDKLAPYYKYQSSTKKFGFTDTVTAVLAESPKGIDRALKEYDFIDVPAEVQKEIFNYMQKLKNMPTEYFEAKITRAVQPKEFHTAVVPDTASAETIKYLKDQGINIKQYKRGDQADRARAIKEAAEENDLLFSKGEKIGGFKSVLEEAISKMPNKMDTASFLKYLKNNGVKDDEINFSGIKDILDQASVTKADVEANFASPRLEKTILKAETPSKSIEEYMREIRQAEKEKDWDTAERLTQEMEDAEFGSGENETKYQRYSTPDVGTNYREVLTTLKKQSVESEKLANERMSTMQKDMRKLQDENELLAEKSSAYAEEKVNEAKEKWKAKNLQVEPEMEKIVLTNIRMRAFKESPYASKIKQNSKNIQEIVNELRRLNKTEVDYKSSHWDEPNVLYHTRLQDVEIEVPNPKYAEKQKNLDTNFDSFYELVDKGTYYKVKRGDTELAASYPKDILKKLNMNAEDLKKYLMEKTELGSRSPAKKELLETHKTKKDKTLLVDEIQSDWHQEGRSKGYKQSLHVNKEFGYKELPDGYTTRVDTNGKVALFKENEKIGSYNDRDEAIKALESKGTPQAPYSKTWHEKAMKDIIDEAIEKGYDRVAWATGKTNAERYSLTKQVDKIEAWINDEDPYANEKMYDISGWDSNGKKVIGNEAIPESRIKDLVGTEMALKIIEDIKAKDTIKYEGQDLTLGGEGMKGFYDKILPEFTNKYIKKFDSKVEIKTLSNGDKVWSFEVTPKMKEQISEKGQPLFAKNEKVAGQKSESVRDVERAVKKLLGKDADKVSDNIVIVEKTSDLPKFIRDTIQEFDSKGVAKADETAMGVYAKDKKVYIVADNIKKNLNNSRSAESVILHELLHKATVGEVVPEAVVSRLSELYKQGDPLVVKAVERTRKAQTSDKNFNHEVIAYLLETYHDGLVKGGKLKEIIENIIRAVKRGMIRVGLMLGKTEASAVQKMNARDIAGFLKQAAIFEGKKLTPRIDMPASIGSRLQEWHKGSAPETKNSDGTPKVFYHGTGANFDKFKVGKAGIFASSNPETAHTYSMLDSNSKSVENSNIMPVYIKLDNPLVVDAKGSFYREITDIDAVKKVNEDEFYTKQARQNSRINEDDGLNKKDTSKFVYDARKYGDSVSVDQIAAYANKNGYDGVVIKNVNDNRVRSEEVGDTVISFAPEKIKSIHNKGTFDETNPNILMSQFKTKNFIERLTAWHKDSAPETKNEDGSPKVFYHGTNANFDEFNTNNSGYYHGKGAYLTDNYNDANKNYANQDGSSIYPVYVNLKNPVVVGRKWEDTRFDEKMQDKLRSLVKGVHFYGANDLEKYIRKSNDEYTAGNELNKIYKELGFDGIIFNGADKLAGHKAPRNTSHVVAFNSEQIKSVYNKGTFDESDSNMLFSKADQEQKIISRTQQAKDWLMDAKETRGINLILKVMTQDQKAEVFGGIAPELIKYQEVVGEKTALSNKLAKVSGEVVNQVRKWAKANPEDADKTFNLMHQTTLEGIDPTMSREEQAQRIDAYNKYIEKHELKLEPIVVDMDKYEDIKLRYDALPAESKQVYEQTKKHYQFLADTMYKAIETKIKKSDIPEEAKTSIMNRLRLEYESRRLAGPYFPLSRFGDYIVQGRNLEGKKVFEMFESPTERDRRAVEMEAAGYTKVKKSARTESKMNLGADTKFMNDVFGKLEKLDPAVARALEDDMYQLYLQNLPNLSARKQFLHRQGVLGYSDDALRVLADKSYHMSRQIGTVKYSGQLEAEISSLEKRVRKTGNPKLKTIYDDMLSTHEHVINPAFDPLAQKLTSFGYSWYLSSASNFFLNLTQLAQVVYPKLSGKYGVAKTTWHMAKASKDISELVVSSFRKDILQNNKEYLSNGRRTDVVGKSIGKFKGDELRAIKYFEESGAVDVTMAHDLAGIGAGDEVKLGALNTVAKIASIPQHYSEIFNRLTTLLASYRLERAHGSSHEAAVKAAERLNNQTNFNMMNENRAAVMRSPFMKVVTQFKSYSQNMAYFMLKNSIDAVRGNKEAAVTMGVLLLSSAFISGVKGLPLQPLEAINLLLNTVGLGYEDFEDDLYKDIKEVFGENADLVWRGALNKLTGADVGGRAGLGDLFVKPPQGEQTTAQAIDFYLQQALGPTWSTFVNMIKGGGEIYKAIEKESMAHAQKAFENLTPKPIRDISKTERYGREGAIDSKYNTVKEEFSARELATQAIGFSPEDLAKKQESNNRQFREKQRADNEKKEIMNTIKEAQFRNDNKLMNRAIEQVKEYNIKYPALAITGDTIVKSIEESARSRAAANMNDGSTIKPKYKLTTEAYK